MDFFTIVFMATVNTSALTPIKSAIFHPFTPKKYTCTEHYEGELPYPGDALGQDCAVVGEGGTSKVGATKNEDYYSWREPVLAPFAGTVVAILVNDVTNKPGTLGKPPASAVIIAREDGVMAMVGHIREIAVEKDQLVTAGEYLGRIGNNGMSTSPHIHMGAWKGDTPLQIRWDLRAMADLRKNGWTPPEDYQP